MDGGNPIGIFDSGIGGLTVLKEVRRLLPHEDIVYLGDTARVPYGTKSPEIVLKYTIRNTLFLLRKKVKALVIACNTASACGLEEVRKHFKIPVLGVITPGARAAVRQSKNKRVGIIGTDGTVRSGAYQKALLELDPQIQVSSQACPLLVSMAEEGWVKGEVVDLVLKQYLKDFILNTGKEIKIDTLILGCTHYPLFKESLTQLLGSQVALVDSAVEVAAELKESLGGGGLLNSQKASGALKIFSTDAPERMQRLGKLFLGSEIPQVEKVEVTSY